MPLIIANSAPSPAPPGVRSRGRSKPEIQDKEMIASYVRLRRRHPRRSGPNRNAGAETGAAASRWLAQRQVDPAVDRAGVHLEAAFPERLLQVSVAQRIAQIIGQCLHYQPCLGVPPFEIILRLALQLLGNGIQNDDCAPLHRERNFHGRSQQRVNHENL